MTPSRRAELRALCDAATPGPWWPRDATRRGTVESHCGHVCTAGFLEACEPDTAFLAAARTAVPELLDALDAAEKERDAWRQRLLREEAERAGVEVGLVRERDAKNLAEAEAAELRAALW